MRNSFERERASVANRLVVKLFENALASQCKETV